MKTKLIIITILLYSYFGFAQQDSVYATVSNDTVAIWNTDINDNCGARYTFSIVLLDSNVIIITEIDTGDVAYCRCTFDLQFQLIGLGNGHYDVEVYRAWLQKYGSPKDTTFLIGTTSFDILNQYSSLITKFTQSPCGGFVGVNTSGLDEFKNFSLSQNYPNPFNPLTVISYQLPVDSWVTLKVYDVLGREVATLINDVKKAGRHEVEWDAAEYSNGIYFYQLIVGSSKVGSNMMTGKMTLIK
ncbi:MAG: hypothetical protein C0417_06380 [Chlorobiaceae bacterium]|nr:hypothetical protein [Chlorobiaceae bacterium]